MKLLLQILPFLFAASPLAFSQNEISTDPGRLATAKATPTAPSILGEIPDGTPPPPALPKPEFVIPQQDILTATTHEQGGRTITVRQIKPIALPPPPPPVETSAAPLDAEFSQRLAEYRDAHPKSDLLLLGATIYRSKDSPPRTLVRFWPNGNRGAITFWSSADFALIAGGIQSFVAQPPTPTNS
jgi:hypothetical protein